MAIELSNSDDLLNEDLSNLREEFVLMSQALFLALLQGEEAFAQELKPFLARYLTLSDEERAAVSDAVPNFVTDELEAFINKKRAAQKLPPLDFSTFGVVALFLVVMVLDETVMIKYFNLDGHWGDSLNRISDLVSDNASAMLVHGSLTGLAFGVSAFVVDKLSKELSNIKEKKSVDWAVLATALGLVAGALNAYDSAEMIEGNQPVVGPVLNEGLRMAGIETGLEVNQSNLIQLSAAATLAFTGLMVSFKRKVWSAARFEVPLSREGVADLRDKTSIRAMMAMNRLPEGCAIPGLVF